MTATGTSPATVTAHDLLLGDRGVVERALARPAAADRIGRLGRLSPAGGHAVRDAVATAIAGLLDIDLVDVLVGGWRRHTALTAAARRTLVAPTGAEVVDLATHTVRFESDPAVELRLDGVTVAQIDVELALAIEVTGLAVTVRRGAITSLSGGRCTATGRLAIQGTDVASRTMTFDPQLAMRLGSGVQIAEPVVPAA